MLFSGLFSDLMHILLQQNVLAHYRRGLVRELASIPDVRLTIVSSEASHSPFLEVAHLPSDFNVQAVNAPVKTWKFTFLGTSLDWQPGAISALRVKPDVVIVMGAPYSLTAWALVILGRLRKIPVLLWTQGILERESGVKWQFRSALFRLASGLLLYGERARELLVQQGVRSDKLHVIYNSLDVKEQEKQYQRSLTFDVEQLRTSWMVDQADRVLIFTGRLQKRKAIDRILGAVTRLNSNGRNVHLLLIGDGTLRVDLETMCNELDIRQAVHFCGPVHSEERLAEAFRVSDLCVIPSGPGLAVMHSLIYGVPVLTTSEERDRYPEAEAIVHTVTGFFGNTGDAGSLANELESILFPRSPRITMEQACRKMILEKFTPQNQAARMARAARTLITINTSTDSLP